MTRLSAAIALALYACTSSGAAAFHPQAQAPLALNSGGARNGRRVRTAPSLSPPSCGGALSAAPRGGASPPTALRSAASSEELDTDALGKYALAAGIQMSLFTGFFKLLDVGIASAGVDPASIPFPAVAVLFYAIALKSRVFNPLNNQRPDRTKAVEGEGSKGFGDRVMPSWTPPGFVFPIMWLLIIGPIRAYSSSLVFQEVGTFCNPALLSLMFHLTCGDIWNTINNTEKRYGASVVGVLCVVASVAFAARQYYEVVPLAGQLLGATAIWLCTATALITDTWRLNPGPSGEREPLYPTVGEAQTEFAWFSSK